MQNMFAVPCVCALVCRASHGAEMPELGLFWFALAGVRGTHRHMSLDIDSYISVDIDILRLGLACAVPDGS